MKKKIINVAGRFLGIVAMTAGVFMYTTCEEAKDNSGKGSDPKEKFHIYLAFGQSNMVGYLGPGANSSWVTDNEFDTPPENFVVMAAANNNNNPYNRKKGEWDEVAKPPLVRMGTGLSPTDFFGRTVAEAVADKGIKVGVIVVAVDGCAINLFSSDIDEFKAYIRSQPDWMRNQAVAYVDSTLNSIPAATSTAAFNTTDYPYKRLVDLAIKAQEEGVIKGIIMHQGESGKASYNASTGAAGDNNTDNAANYAKAVRQIYNDLCDDLGLKKGKVPFLAGQAVQNNNSNIAAIPGAFTDLPNTAFVISSDGCLGWNPSSSDTNQKIHFSFDGYKELGKRYGEKMLELLY